MNILRTLALGLAGSAIAATALIAASHEPAVDPAVKARQAAMTLYAFNLGTLGGMAQGKSPYDAAAAQGAASNLVKLSSLAAAPMWAPGTDSEAMDASNALPAIWEDMDGVIKAAIALNEAAVAMETASGQSLEALQAAMGPLGGACGACHKSYREAQ